MMVSRYDKAYLAENLALHIGKRDLLRLGVVVVFLCKEISAS